MAKVSSETAAEQIAFDGVEVRLEPLEGGYTVCFEEHTADGDLAELFRGLPDDRAQFPRWGYVLAGKVGFRFPDREGTFEGGDASSVSPGAERAQFTPTEIPAETIPVVLKNLEAAGATTAPAR